MALLQGIGPAILDKGMQAVRGAGKSFVGAAGAVALAPNAGAWVVGAELSIRLVSSVASCAESRLPNWVTSRRPTLTSDDPKTVKGVITSWVRMARMGNWTVQFGTETPRKLTNRELLALGIAFAVMGNAAAFAFNRFSCLKPLATHAGMLVRSVLPFNLTTSPFCVTR